MPPPRTKGRRSLEETVRPFLLLEDFYKVVVIRHFPRFWVLLPIMCLVGRSCIYARYSFELMITEFTIVVADGTLLTANEVDNPDCKRTL